MTAADDESILEVRAELDVPGETTRQARVFLVWFVCLAIAVIGGSLVGAHIPFAKEGTTWAEEQLTEARVRKAKVAFSIGLVLPALLTWGLHAHHRRGGRHARGIVVDVTRGGELRIWGRGYGTRVAVAPERITERLVDVYAGRLGAWRQRRIGVRGPGSRHGRAELEIATTAVRVDADEGLRVDGGEGDCIELARPDFDRVRDALLEVASA